MKLDKVSAFILVTIDSVLLVLLGPVRSLTSVSTSKNISDQSLKKKKKKKSYYT